MRKPTSAAYCLRRRKNKNNMEEKNVFGQPLKDGQVVEPTPPAATTAEKKPDEKPVEDIEKNPLVLELRKQIEDTKKSYGGNLVEQRNKIDRLEKQIKDLSGKKTEEKPKPLFEKIVRVKDLPKDERDAMSETEKRLFDANADMQERLNEMAAANQKPAENKQDGDEPASTFDVNKAVQDEAMKLADGNYTKAQELIGKFNSLDFDLTKITAENLAERLASVVALIPDFKPKQEQQTGNGGAVKDGKASTGVDAAISAAVAEQQGKNTGNYAL